MRFFVLLILQYFYLALVSNLGVLVQIGAGRLKNYLLNSKATAGLNAYSSCDLLHRISTRIAPIFLGTNNKGQGGRPGLCIHAVPLRPPSVPGVMRLGL